VIGPSSSCGGPPIERLLYVRRRQTDETDVAEVLERLDPGIEVAIALDISTRPRIAAAIGQRLAPQRRLPATTELSGDAVLSGLCGTLDAGPHLQLGARLDLLEAGALHQAAP
jgi:hypothetical protein